MTTNIRYIIFILFSFLVFDSCSERHKTPNDFGFKITEETESINSFDSIYKRSYVNYDTTIKLEFTKAELNSVYEAIINNGLDNYPDSFVPSCRVLQLPRFTTTLVYLAENKEKKFVIDSDCTQDVLKFWRNYKIKKVKRVISLIHEIVNSKKEIKKLPESDMIFM